MNRAVGGSVMRVHTLARRSAIALVLVGITASGHAQRAADAEPVAPRSGTSAAAPKPLPLPASQALVDRYVAQEVVPGMVIAIGHGDAPTKFATAGRIAFEPDAPAAGPDSLWRVYSMTKPITAVAAMVLIEEGRIKLDEPVATYIPAFGTMRVLIDPKTGLASRPAARSITIRNLLTHTAGFLYPPNNPSPLAADYNKNGVVPLTVSKEFENRTRPGRAPTLEAFANRVAAEPLLFEPGTQYSYGVAMDVMGRVIEVASGMSFDGFVQQRIFDPLGMTSSFWTVPGRDAARLATNYVDAKHNRDVLDPGRGSLWLSPPSFPYGGAGLVMSARDYDSFLHMLQNLGTLRGKRILKRDTASLMMSNLLPAGVSFGGGNGTARATASGGPTGYGAGGSVYIVAGPGGYPGIGTYGWGGAAGSFAFVDPANRTRGVMMINVMGGIPGMREASQAAIIADQRAAPEIDRP